MAIERLRHYERSRESLQEAEGLQREPFTFAREGREFLTFMSYGDLLISQEHCSLCKLILECHTSKDDWNSPVSLPDLRPNVEDSPAIDVQLKYWIDSSSAAISSCATLSGGTETAKFAKAQISLPVCFAGSPSTQKTAKLSELHRRNALWLTQMEYKHAKMNLYAQPLSARSYNGWLSAPLPNIHNRMTSACTQKSQEKGTMSHLSVPDVYSIYWTSKLLPSAKR